MFVCVRKGYYPFLNTSRYNALPNMNEMCRVVIKGREFIRNIMRNFDQTPYRKKWICLLLNYSVHYLRIVKHHI